MANKMKQAIVIYSRFGFCRSDVGLDVTDVWLMIRLVYLYLRWGGDLTRLLVSSHTSESKARSLPAFWNSRAGRAITIAMRLFDRRMRLHWMCRWSTFIASHRRFSPVRTSFLTAVHLSCLCFFSLAGMTRGWRSWAGESSVTTECVLFVWQWRDAIR